MWSLALNVFLGWHEVLKSIEINYYFHFPPLQYQKERKVMMKPSEIKPETIINTKLIHLQCFLQFKQYPSILLLPPHCTNQLRYFLLSNFHPKSEWHHTGCNTSTDIIHFLAKDLFLFIFSVKVFFTMWHVISFETFNFCY